jgi:Rod binding domain-containing protein
VSTGAFSIPAQRSPQELVAQPAALKDKDAEAAKQFEGMLMANLFQTLRKTVTHSTLFGNPAGAQSTYEYLLDQAVVNHAVATGSGWGLSDRLQASFKTSGTQKQKTD